MNIYSLNPPLHQVRWIILGMLILVGYPVLKAQPRIIKGTVKPLTAPENTWFWDTQQHTMFRFHKREWESWGGDCCIDFRVCNNYVILIEKDSAMNLQRGHGYLAIDARQFHSTIPISKFYCMDQVFCYQNYSIVQCVDSKATELSNNAVTRPRSINCYPFQMDSVAGKVGICAPSFYPAPITDEYLNCNVMHNWGFITSNKDWLIQPIFDAPFHFENGVADVLYYGQKRKINEKGEFVE